MQPSSWDWNMAWLTVQVRALALCFTPLPIPAISSAFVTRPSEVRWTVDYAAGTDTLEPFRLLEEISLAPPTGQADIHLQSCLFVQRIVHQVTASHIKSKRMLRTSVILH